MSAQVIGLHPEPEHFEICLIDGCGRDVPANPHQVLVTGYDLDGLQQTIEIALCRPHGLAFELVRLAGTGVNQ